MPLGGEKTRRRGPSSTSSSRSPDSTECTNLFRFGRARSSSPGPEPSRSPCSPSPRRLAHRPANLEISACVSRAPPRHVAQIKRLRVSETHRIRQLSRALHRAPRRRVTERRFPCRIFSSLRLRLAPQLARPSVVARAVSASTARQSWLVSIGSARAPPAALASATTPSQLSVPITLAKVTPNSHATEWRPSPSTMASPMIPSMAPSSPSSSLRSLPFVAWLKRCASAAVRLGPKHTRPPSSRPITYPPR